MSYSNINDNLKQRARILFLFFLLLFFIIIIRLFYVAALKNDYGKIKKKYDPLYLGKRGKIIDRNDVVVSTDLKISSLYVNTALLKNPQELAEAISRTITDISYDEIIKKINDSNKSKNWILIKRNLTPLQVQKINQLKIASLVFEDNLTRIYPQKEIASHLIGYVDTDRKGLAGIEMANNEELSRVGSEVKLAMDVRIQDVLYSELLSGMQKYKAKAASGLVFNVNNGEIIAISSLPTFDPNLQNEANSNQRFNRATGGVYELGSIFKIFTLAAAFEKNLVKINDVFNVSQPIKYGRYTINDDHHYKDILSVAEIFAQSSNIGTIQIAKKLGVDNLREFLKKLNLLNKLDVDFPGLATPIFPEHWREINLFTISYGHGIAVSPLHMAVAVSAIVNGGYLLKPSFIKVNEDDIANNRRKIFNEDLSIKMREVMKKAVIDGTGKKAAVNGYEVGGKTGTANLIEYGGYNEKSNRVSFVAVFPISKPEYLVMVSLDRPNYIFNTGGMVAAPVAGEIVKNIAPILTVKPMAERKNDDN